MKSQADIGVVGLAVMGENLILNMESRGFTVACFNRTVEKVAAFVGGRGQGKNLIGCRSIPEFVAALARPRKIMMMVRAGRPVDDLIGELCPLLEPGDILIDGGNSHYPDTVRRRDMAAKRGLLYVGAGVSGGEEGALKAPPSCPAATQRPGRISSRFSKPSPPRSTASPAANGLALTAPATS